MKGSTNEYRFFTRLLTARRNNKTIHMKKIFLTAFICFPFAALAQSTLFKPQLALLNTRIDTIVVSNYLLNEPTDKDFSSKFKVLEFWATWCRPCLKAVPHLNRLQTKFKDSNIVFFSFTYEKPEKAAEAFKKVNFETIVVSDTNKVIHRKLLIEMNGTMPLPRTVLIDDQNRIVWYGSPEKLNAKLLEKFLRKESLTD
jgi:thiol-disulfide isomerase/thioredoxin